MLLEGKRSKKRQPNVSIGRIVSEVNINLLGMLILCKVPQFSHLIGL